MHREVLSGRTNIIRGKQYYFPISHKYYNKCKTVTSVLLKPLEKTIFETLFENIVGVPHLKTV